MMKPNPPAPRLRFWLAWSLAGVVAGGMGLAWRLNLAAPDTQRGSPETVVAAPFPQAELGGDGCSFRQGDTLAFALETRVEPAGPPGQGPSDRFSAGLSLEVVGEVAPGQWLVRAAFSSIALAQQVSQVDQRVAQPLDASFMFRIGRDCRFLGKGYRQSWQPTTRRFVSTVLSTFEFAVASVGRQSSWEAEQNDGLGTYVAKYSAQRLATGALEMTRVKTRYRTDERRKGLGIQVQLVFATANATLVADGRWLDQLRGEEKVEIRANGTVLAGLEQHYQLTRNDAAFVRPDGAVNEASLDWQDPFLMATQVQASVDPALLNMSLDAALNRFAQVYSKAKNGDAYAAALFLAQWLKIHPAEATRLLAQLRGTQIAEHMRPAVFLALEQCGTPQARAVLSEAVADKSFPELDRARAASALSDVPEPSRESSRALTEAARDSESKLVAGTSIRALGHLVQRAGKLKLDFQDELRGSLRDELRAATDGSRAIDVVDAIGNTGDTSFVQELAARLTDSSSAAMREHAARAFRGMAPVGASALLLAQLGAETDPAVRAAIVETLLALGIRDEEALSLAAGQLQAEPSPVVRAALIRWLGAAVESPTAHTALRAQFRRESLPALLQLIGRYLPADDLK